MTANLTESDNWSAAVDECDAIFHVVSPVSTTQPKNPDDAIEPDIKGKIDVLEAVASLGINRVVLTYLVTAILGEITENQLYMGNNWSDSRMTPYATSKTLAERCAWGFGNLKDVSLTTIHPAMALVPALETGYGISLTALVKLLQ